MSMVKTILFRGGMTGDLLLGMLDKSSLEPLQNLITIEDSTCVDHKINRDRILMKKFFRYDQEEKDLYYKDIVKYNQNIYVLSHDTDYCLEKIPQNTIQLICSDEGKIEKFAERFKSLHRDKVIEEAAKAINGSIKTFVRDYTDSITLWQNCFKFEHRFDIKNIGKLEFIDDIEDYFKCDRFWCEYIYKKWLQKEKILI